MAEERQGLQGMLSKLLKDTKDSTGKDLYSHLQKVLVHIALTDPTTALDKFEEISHEIRTKQKFEPPEYFLNYSKLALASKSFDQAIHEKFYEVFSFPSSKMLIF